MIRFDCDYVEGAHEAILRRMLETNMEQTAGYGEDEICERARQKIRAACRAPGAAVHFLVRIQAKLIARQPIWRVGSLQIIY